MLVNTHCPLCVAVFVLVFVDPSTGLRPLAFSQVRAPVLKRLEEEGGREGGLALGSSTDAVAPVLPPHDAGGTGVNRHHRRLPAVASGPRLAARSIAGRPCQYHHGFRTRLGVQPRRHDFFNQSCAPWGSRRSSRRWAARTRRRRALGWTSLLAFALHRDSEESRWFSLMHADQTEKNMHSVEFRGGRRQGRQVYREAAAHHFHATWRGADEDAYGEFAGLRNEWDP